MLPGTLISNRIISDKGIINDSSNNFLMGERQPQTKTLTFYTNEYANLFTVAITTINSNYIFRKSSFFFGIGFQKLICYAMATATEYYW